MNATNVETPDRPLHILGQHKTIDNAITTAYVILECGTGIIATTHSATEMGRELYRRVKTADYLCIDYNLPDDHHKSFYSDFNTLDCEERKAIDRGYRMERESITQRTR